MIIVDTIDDDLVAGARWWQTHAACLIGFDDWLKSVGGKKVVNYSKGQIVVSFDNEEDAIMFKLKYL